MHPQYPYTSRYTKIEGHRLHYLDEGNGPVVLLLHGNPTWSFYYRNLIRDLKKSHRVIAVDHIGCGLSDKPVNYAYTLENHINNLQKLIENIGIEKYSMVMHDWGGAIGFGLLARNADRIHKIIIHNTAAFPSRRIPWRIAICKTPYLGAFMVKGCNAFARAATFMAVGRKMDRLTRTCYLHPYDTWNHRIAVYQFVRDIPLSKRHKSYRTLLEAEMGIEKINRRKTPVLLLWGGKDFCFTQHFYKEWKKRLPFCTDHYFEKFGHYLLEDGKEEVNAYIAEFLEEKKYD